MLKIALTGGIACGKSKTLQALQELGFETIELDNLSKKILKDKNIITQLINIFGRCILNRDNSINRIVLQELLLESEINKTHIEKILHPAVFQAMQMQISQLNTKVVIIEIPILTKDNIGLFDRVIKIECNSATQIKRLMQRDKISSKLASKKINIQKQDLNFIKIPIDIINNNSSIDELKINIQKLSKNY